MGPRFPKIVLKINFYQKEIESSSIQIGPTSIFDFG
jgi:hypothetical protein